MVFEQKHLYHIYNQGNNRGKIFFTRENYFFFLKKTETHILPHADVLAYCLMPNHFHLLVHVHNVEINLNTHLMTQSHLMSIPTNLMTQGHLMSIPVIQKKQTMVESIAIMLRSYTRAINKQENRSGSLFRPHTKSECLTKSDNISPSFIKTSNGAIINIPDPEKEYPKVCFNYIHNNPVKAGLVNDPGDWKFSSYQGYYGSGDVTLINIARAKEFGLL